MDLKHPKRGSLIEEAIFARGGKIPDSLYKEDGSIDIVGYCIEYTKRLEAKGRFKLCIWPEHCLMGSNGHSVVPAIQEAVNEWSNSTGGSPEWVNKGQNLLTEMYSALCAEVPVSKRSAFDFDLFESIKEDTTNLIACGQALSHCVNYTVRDIVEHWPKEEMGKITILKDCASSVPGFEEAGELFLKDMKEAGVNVETTATFKL